MPMLRGTSQGKTQKFKIEKKTGHGVEAIMPKVFDITTTQFYKVLCFMKENPEMTCRGISIRMGIPVPSIRRIISELDSVGKIEKKIVNCVYSITEDPVTENTVENP